MMYIYEFKKHDIKKIYPCLTMTFLMIIAKSYEQEFYNMNNDQYIFPKPFDS